tara:strand:+ start:245 stop:430 length:186 start_codon:yes stop_codon:yes gene_type:complete
MKEIISRKDVNEIGLASYYFSANLSRQANATRNFQQNPKQDFPTEPIKELKKNNSRFLITN